MRGNQVAHACAVQEGKSVNRPFVSPIGPWARKRAHLRSMKMVCGRMVDAGAVAEVEVDWCQRARAYRDPGALRHLRMLRAAYRGARIG